MLSRTIAVFAVASFMVAMALVPGAIAAEAPKLAFDAAFELPATHGYKVFGLITSTGTVGSVSLFVSKGDGVAIYAAKGAGTANSVDIDLGRLGKVDVEAHPTGADQVIHRGCGGKGKKLSAPVYELVGPIEFHGEEGFAEASTASTQLLFEPILDLVCGGYTMGETSGEGLPGVRLAASSASGPSLTLQQNRPGAPVFYEATENEKRGPVRIERTLEGHLGAGALDYDRSLARASFSAAAPFSGAATYREHTPPHEARPGRGSWRGSLKVDFPGDAGARLAGPAFEASIIHARRTETN